MPEIDAKKIYLQIKTGERTYNEEVHCPMVLHVMNTKGTMTAFCKEAGISDALFYKWTMQYPIFKECYEMGKVYSKSNWEEEGENGKDEEFFNFDYWRLTGACRYGVGRNRVRMAVDSESNPYEQYQQLIRQAGTEEFTAAEIKQLMESINVGRSAFEAFKLQEEMDAMKEDVARMKINHAHNTGTVKAASETN